MSKKILGLDLGTNSIGWALLDLDFDNKQGAISAIGSRIIPMTQDVLGKFDSGQTISQTAERTRYRGVRRLYERNILRRERLHRVLNIIKFLPDHYANAVDFEKHLGQFKKGLEPKLNYRKNNNGKHEFIFQDSFLEMVTDFKITQPELFIKNQRGEEGKIPYDWTLYYLRKKALKQPVTKEELAWIILNFNQKRGYYQLRGEDENFDSGKVKEYYSLKVTSVHKTGDTSINGNWYEIVLENGFRFRRTSKVDLNSWVGKNKEFIVTTDLEKDGTSKLDKEGNIKRSFKTVDSEKDWIAIKKKTELDLETSGKFICEYIYDTLLKNPFQKIRGKLIKTIERDYYKKELIAILKEQASHHPELRNKNLYKTCLDELYPRNEGHKNNIKDQDLSYLIIEDIIFYQRPLKSKKSLISNCQYESRNYYDIEAKEKKEVPVKVVPKSHPLYQEFRLWQFLSNLKLFQKQKVINNKTVIDYNITHELLHDESCWVELFDFLNTKKEIEQHQLLKFFSDKKLIPKQKKNEPNYRWNYPEDKKYPCNETKALLISRLKNTIENPEKFLSPKVEYHLWHIIYSVKDKNEFERALETFANRYNFNKAKFAEGFKKTPPFKNDYGAYSEKALKKLLPLMRRGWHWNQKDINNATLKRIYKIIDGEYDKHIKNEVREKAIHLTSVESFSGLPVWLACYIVYSRHSESDESIKWDSPADINLYLEKFKQHSLNNPIVEQVVTETLRTVRDIWKYYGNGEKDFFNEIHVELGREMKNPKAERERLSGVISKNENTNNRIKELLKELMHDDGIEGEIQPYSPSQQEILKIFEEGVYQSSTAVDDAIDKIRKKTSPNKEDIVRYKLWLEQGYISPYTGKTISLSRLFTTDYQIEHIIPQSRYFDNSFGNKIICESHVNQLKDNQTAFEFIKNHGGEKVDLGQGRTVEVFKPDVYEAHCQKYYSKNTGKLKRLLSEEIPESFISRQINDTRYISKLIKNLMSNVVREEGELETTSKNMVLLSGAITSKLKKDWGLNDKWNELVAPRFQRLNELTHSNDFGFWDTTINAFRTKVPDEISRGFNKKRIDHRHHALDAIVIACCTKDHVNYITSLNTQRKNYSLVSKLRHQEDIVIKGVLRKVAKAYKLPWENFTTDAKNALETTVVSFKQNLRVINKNVNWFWSYKDENGKLNKGKDGAPKKKLRKQIKGDNWAIRKPLHKEFVYGKLDMEVPKGKLATAIRKPLSEIKNNNHINKIADRQIREIILPNHLQNYLDIDGNPNFEAAFNQDGIDDLNKNIRKLNNGKPHQPIYKVPIYEIGSKFPISENINNVKNKKYVEADKGTNLYFALYWNEERQKREYQTIPLNEVIEHQKLVSHLPKKERLPIPLNPKKGALLFTLSPNDLVYVPTNEEIINPSLVDFQKLSKDQVERIYSMKKATGSQCFFLKSTIATSIKDKFEFSSSNSMERSIEGEMIKNICWKLIVNRLGEITRIVTGIN